MKYYKKQIQNFIWSLIILIFIVITFNYYMDVSGLFGNKSDISKAAKIIVDGYKVAGLNNHDERLLNEIIIRKTTKKNDVIVIGSSRSMLLRKEYLNKHQDINFFNHSMSGLYLPDMMALIRFYEKNKNYIPKEIVLSIDPWMFSKHGMEGRSLANFKDYYNELLGILDSNQNSLKNEDLKWSEVKKWSQLVNFDYTLANIKYLKKTFNKNNMKVYKVDNINVDDFIVNEDGSIYYPFKTRYKNPSELEKEMKREYVPKAGDHLEKSDIIYNTKIFEKYVKFLMAKDIKVTILLPPFHPSFYNRLVNKLKYDNIVKTEKFLKNFSLQNNINLIGSYDPTKYGFTNKDFFDGVHGQEVVMKRLMQNYK